MILAVLKVIEHYTKNKPDIKIDILAPNFYVESGKENITFEFELDLTNIGTVPVQFRGLNFKILDDKKQIIENIIFEESLSYYLEPWKHEKRYYERETINEKYYSNKLFVEIEIISTVKKWKITEEFLSIEEVMKSFNNTKSNKASIVGHIEGTVEEVKLKEFKIHTK